MSEKRYRIVIRCLECGEKYVLRGRRKELDEYETGFKRCTCGNDTHLNVEATEE